MAKSCRVTFLRDSAGADISGASGPITSEVIQMDSFDQASVHVVGTAITTVEIQVTNFDNENWLTISELTDPTNNFFDLQFTAAKCVRVVITGGTDVSAKITLEG